jgi:hypothetical protein
MPDGRHRVEGSRILHDLLSGRAAVDVAASRRGGGDRRRVALVFLPARDVPAVDADDAVRADQRGDQRVPARRPCGRDDRAGPDNATALLLYYIYAIGFRFWDTAYAAALTMVLLALLGGAALAQFWFLERKIHYQ